MHAGAKYLGMSFPQQLVGIHVNSVHIRGPYQ